MKRALVTGAGGFVGRALVQRLLAEPGLERLTAIDLRFDTSLPWPGDSRLVRCEGDFADPALLSEVLAEPVDVVFHLASVPGSLAEREPQIGLQVNLQGSVDLLRYLASMSADRLPRVVFASTVAVYGLLDPDTPINESAPERPALSYGAHKRMVEILLADLTRRGELDGVSLRLPGIVARPLSPTGHGSAFMSDLIRRLAASEAYECPVSPQARAWWMSLSRCIDNLLHAARLPVGRLPAGRTIQLPVVAATVAEVVAAIESRRGTPAAVRYRPDERVEEMFGRMPLLSTPFARSLGFVDDGDVASLVARAVAETP